MRRLLLSIMISMSMFMPVLLSSGLAMAAPPNPNACPDAGTSKGEVLNGIGESGNDCDSSGVNSVFHGIVVLISFIAGIIAVIMIILAGIRYITSAGDPNKVSGAKNTLIYALIGILVAALAQILVHFVLYNANNDAG
jgi:hypothetical protein